MKTIIVACFWLTMMTSAVAQISKFVFPQSGLELERRTQSGLFFDVVGRKAFVVGYENRALEAWVYPLKIADDFKLAFKLAGYPLAFNGADIQVRINVRPEATTFTYSHTAFSVKQTIFAPLEEPGVVMLLDVNTVPPLEIIASFRPKLSLMWPAGLMTNYVDYNKAESVYYLGEETGKFIGIVGSPALKDLSQMPYQEEPKDVPTKFVIEVPAETLQTHFIPIVIAGSVKGRAAAKATYDKLLSQTKPLYEATVAHYKKLNEETLSVVTPDERLNKAFAWAKVGESSQSLKLLSALPSERELNLVVEGLSERTYDLHVRSHKPIVPEVMNAEVRREDGGALLQLKMPRAAEGGFVRREIPVKFAGPEKPAKRK